MLTIHKFILEDTLASDTHTVNLPKGAEVLTIKSINDVPVIWAIVDTSAVLEPREFRFYNTGEELPENRGKYIGTLEINSHIHHFFERW